MNVFKTTRSALPKQLRELSKMENPYAIRPKIHGEVDLMLSDMGVREYDSVHKIFLAHPAALKRE